MIRLRQVGLEASALVQEVLDAVPAYNLRVEGVVREPDGAHATLTTLPTGCAAGSKYVLLIEVDGERAPGGPSVLSVPRGEGEETVGLPRGEGELSAATMAVGLVDLIHGYPDAETAFIGLFLLREGQQGRGLGRQAYAQVEDFACSRLGCKKLRLAVVDSNPVISFWQKMGFTLTGESGFHEGSGGVRSIKRLMQKELLEKGLAQKGQRQGELS